MEDRIVLEASLRLKSTISCSLFAVLDGHSGLFAADYIAEHLASLVSAEINKLQARALSVDSLTAVLTAAVAECERSLAEQPAVKGSGSTLVCALVTDDLIAVANVGDSRCLLGQLVDTTAGGICAVPLTEDHKAKLENERARVEAAGMFVRELGPGKWYVCDVEDGEPKGIEIARSIGDFFFKSKDGIPADEQALIAVPDVRVIERNDKTAFLGTIA
jgi:protein phosphatase 2C family protein 2/3